MTNEAYCTSSALVQYMKVNTIHCINSLKKINLVIIFIDAEKLFHSTFFTKFNSHPRNTKELFNMIKSMYLIRPCSQHTYLMVETEDIPPRMWEQGRMHHHQS